MVNAQLATISIESVHSLIYIQNFFLSKCVIEWYNWSLHSKINIAIIVIMICTIQLYLDDFVSYRMSVSRLDRIVHFEYRPNPWHLPTSPAQQWHNRCGTIKIPPCLRPLPNFFIPSPFIVTSLCKQIVFECMGR